MSSSDSEEDRFNDGDEEEEEEDKKGDQGDNGEDKKDGINLTGILFGNIDNEGRLEEGKEKVREQSNWDLGKETNEGV